MDAETAAAPNRAAGPQLSSELLAILRCPHCGSGLVSQRILACAKSQCGRVFPVCGGVPVLINEERSLFTVAGVTSGRQDFFSAAARARARWAPFLPSPTLNLCGRRNLQLLGRLSRRGDRNARVLVIGSGMSGLSELTGVELIRTDVCFSQDVHLVCDAHDLPLAEASMDGVVIQAVLQHVVDPKRCVQEIQRVLRPGGMVYAETAFLQHVCGGAFDFTRFTARGHRILFRDFDEIAAGSIGGPGSVLCWALIHFASVWCPNRRLRRLLKAVATAVFFPLKYTDAVFAKLADISDAAPGMFFLGRKISAPAPVASHPEAQLFEVA